MQLSLAKKYHLPLFLHSRAAHDDFTRILKEEGFGESGGSAMGAKGGVVHSFTGLSREAEDYVGIYTFAQVFRSRAVPLDEHGFLRRVSVSHSLANFSTRRISQHKRLLPENGR